MIAVEELKALQPLDTRTDGRAASANSAFGRRYPVTIKCMAKGNF
jgi:hypothetical protein